MARSAQQRSQRPVRHTAAALSPYRLTLLKGLEAPESASGLAPRLGLPRQQVNYHLRELERAGFIELGETRQRHHALLRRLAEIDAGIEHDPLAACPAVTGMSYWSAGSVTF